MNITVNEKFVPHVENLLSVLYNKRPEYLPLYEHHIDAPFISKVLGMQLSSKDKSPSELEDYYAAITKFWADNTYDAFDFEAAICDIFPQHGAILGGQGPIQERRDFEKYPWREIPEIFKKTYTPHLNAIRKVMPHGMKAYGGCGYGIFEAAQDLVGYEYLCIMQIEEPELFADLFLKIGELYETLWTWILKNYADIFIFCRMGDDLGHKTSTMLSPQIIKEHILPQHKRVIDIVHKFGKKFLMHSCGNIFCLMDDIIANGIDAKHSNEDVIAPFDKWIENYSDKIGLMGGIDMNVLILNPYDVVFKKVLEDAARFRKNAKGYALGSGNSIPDYMSKDGFFAMIDAAKEIRRREKTS